MIDQSFSSKNFRYILDLENRKGIHVEEKLSILNVSKINTEIKDCNNLLRITRKKKLTDTTERLYNYKKDLRIKKDLLLEDELDKISKNVSSNSFRILLLSTSIPGNKKIYTIPNSPSQFFAIKQLQKNLSRVYSLKQSNKNSILEQVTILLNDLFPKIVIKTDIKDFYESISHDFLLDRIVKDNLLSPFSRKLVENLLDGFKKIANVKKGIPRGIGVSPFLSELYMQEIDNKLRNIPDVTYYSRYVDDIIIVITPRQINHTYKYLELVKNTIKEYGLKHNTSKTDEYDLMEKPENPSTFEFLGYKFLFGCSEVKTSLTRKKINKYKNRIRLAFDDYKNLKVVNEKKARSIFVKRIRFLTGNTKLKNNKKNILTGIYYSNLHLTEIDQLKGLDHFLEWHKSRLTSDSLKTRLRKYSFYLGFKEQRFSPFKTNELTEIMKIW